VPDIMLTGFSGAERGEVRLGRHRRDLRSRSDRLVRDGRSQAVRRDHNHRYRAAARAPGDGPPRGRGPRNRLQPLGPGGGDSAPIGRRGIDVAIEALGTQPTFEACLRCYGRGHAV
jgi:hypothetical protein